MSVQHEYRGFGDPNGNIIAEVNSHYLNEETGQAWLCIRNTGSSAEWALIGGHLRDAAGERYDFYGPEYFDGVVGASVRFVFNTTARIFCNVDLSGEPREFYTPGAASRVEVRPVGTNDLMVCVTPLTDY